MTADIIKGICDDSLELSAEVVCKELFEVHDGGKVFLAEPRATLADFGLAEHTAVATRCLAPYPIVLPKTVLKELLGKLHLKESTIVTHG